MRVHVQNPENETVFPVTPTQWAAAVARHPDMADLRPSFADDEAGFQAAIGEAELLVTWVRIVHQRLADGGLKQLAPKLRTIFCTSAGLDRLAPFDWLPPDVALLNNRGTHGAKAGEFGLMALLMLANHIPAFAQAQGRGEWAPKFGSVLAGRKVVVVGLGSLGGAVSDVAVPEPLPADHRLWSVPGLFITPHMSSDDPATYNDDSLDILFANLRAAREGRPMHNRIDPANGY
jgi:phosphoglycerate dehydrogenase-like enzyme